MTPIFLRLGSETKHLERRSALSPKTVKALVEAGHSVNVECCARYIFRGEGFAAAGANLVPEDPWSDVPNDYVIIGLKEPHKDDLLLIHPHIHLPSLVASEASNAFSTLLLPSLLTLDRRGEGGVWVRAEKLFREKVEEIPKSE